MKVIPKLQDGKKLKFAQYTPKTEVDSYGIPNKIANTPSIIELQIFEDEQIHLPFHIECIPSNKYKIIVKKFNDNKIISEYEVSSNYNSRFNDLLKDCGIIIKNGKWKYVNKL